MGLKIKERKKENIDSKQLNNDGLDGMVNRVKTLLGGIILVLLATLIAVSAGQIFEYITKGKIKVEAVVAAISAGFVVLQLRSGEKQEKHMAAVEEAEFILDFNKSFIESEKLTEIERYLECRLTGADYGLIKNLKDYRQEMVNYLVYLEGLAAYIHSGMLSFPKIDDLLAYRYFIAMNHIETQTIDLLPYAAYYRGCFRVYEKWLGYRMTCGKYSEENDWEIPLFSTALCNHYGYEKYACPEMVCKVTQQDKQQGLIFSAEIPKKGWVKLCLYPDNRVELSYKVKKNDTPVYLSLLRRVLKEVVYANEVDNEQFKELIANSGIQGRKEVLKQFYDQAGRIGVEIFTAAEDDDEAKAAVKLFNALRHTKEVIIAREQAEENQLQFEQLSGQSTISTEEYDDIVKLIYQTDKYIYPDMFGNEQTAKIVLPKLFEEKKDAMFKKENVFVCRAGSKIVGVILWHKGQLNWSEDELKRKIEIQLNRHNVEGAEREKVLAKLEKVSRTYMNNYSDTRETSTDIVILNFCVDPEFRGLKIASAMLQSFFDSHKEESFELCVLSDNTSAIKAYERSGFVVTGEEEAYPPGKPNHWRKVMKKQKKGDDEHASLSEKVQNQFRCCCCKKRTGIIR